MLIIGSKPLKNINIDDILDSFEKNIRFNFNIPNNNNGTKQCIRIMNNHTYFNKSDKELINSINKTKNNNGVVHCFASNLDLRISSLC